MSKSDLTSSYYTDDPVPSYEEALASSTTPSSDSYPRQRPTTNTSNIRQERTRRIFRVVSDFIIPCFASHVSNLCHNVTIVLVPADTLPASALSTVTSQSIVSPSLQNHRTTGNVVALTGDDDRSSFWTQQTVVQELDVILRSQLSRPTPPSDRNSRPQLSEKSQPLSSLPPLQVQPAPGALLPARPVKQSWLKRTFAMPGEDHDPTGETGKWNLGWRTHEMPEFGNEQSSSWTLPPARVVNTLLPDEAAVHTQLRNVSFRTESEMGLLETSTIKCVWIEIEVGV